MKLHCVYRHFLYPFIHWWTARLITWLLWLVLQKLWVFRYLSSNLILILMGIYPEVVSCLASVRPRVQTPAPLKKVYIYMEVLKILHIDFHSGYVNLHLYQQCTV
jgi:hypothetical protein